MPHIKPSNFFYGVPGAPKKPSRPPGLRNVNPSVAKDLFDVRMDDFAQAQGFVPSDGKYDGLETGAAVTAIMKELDHQRETVGFSDDNVIDSDGEESGSVHDVAAVTVQGLLAELEQINEQKEPNTYLDWVQKVFASAPTLFDDLIARVDALNDEQGKVSEYLDESWDQLHQLEEHTEEYYSFYVNFLGLLKSGDMFGEEVNLIKYEINCLIAILNKIYFDQNLQWQDDETKTFLQKMLSQLDNAVQPLNSRLNIVGDQLDRFLNLVKEESKFKDEMSARLKEYPELVQWMCGFNDKLQEFFSSSEPNFSAFTVAAPAFRAY